MAVQSIYLKTDDGYLVTTDDGDYIVVGYEDVADPPSFVGTFSYTIGF